MAAAGGAGEKGRAIGHPSGVRFGARLCNGALAALKVFSSMIAGTRAV
jgi:hypothetical protein